MSSEKSKILADARVDFAKRIRDWRRGQNLTQEQLAELLGFKKAYYSLIETGKKPPSGKFMRSIINRFGADLLADLFGQIEKPLLDDRCIPLQEKESQRPIILRLGGERLHGKAGFDEAVITRRLSYRPDLLLPPSDDRSAGRQPAPDLPPFTGGQKGGQISETGHPRAREDHLRESGDQPLNPGLESFISDKQLQIDLAVSEEELVFLASILIYGNIPVDKEFYVNALIYHRRTRAAKSQEPS